MFFTKKKIKITMKFYMGLEKKVNIEGFDLKKGVTLDVKNGSRLKTVLHSLGLDEIYSNAYFLNGKRIGTWKKLKDGDEITCLRPVAGG